MMEFRKIVKENCCRIFLSTRLVVRKLRKFRYVGVCEGMLDVSRQLWFEVFVFKEMFVRKRFD